MIELERALHAFSARANGHAHVRDLVRHWKTEFYVQSSDSLSCFRLVLRDGEIIDVETTTPPIHEVLLLRGETDVLRAVFSGSEHPLTAYNEGHLQIYGPQADQNKLDAISLLIWGA